MMAKGYGNRVVSLPRPCAVILITVLLTAMTAGQALAAEPKQKTFASAEEAIKALVAAPVPMPMPDVYEALRREVLEGTMLDLSVLRQWKFAEVEKFVTANWQLGTGYTFYFVMNKNKWNSLPADVKKLFSDVAAEFAEKQAVTWNDIDREAIDYFKKSGGQTIYLSDEEGAKWKKASGGRISFTIFPGGVQGWWGSG